MKDTSQVLPHTLQSSQDFLENGDQNTSSGQTLISNTLIVLFFSLSTIASFSRLGTILNYAVPAIALLTAIYFYYKDPASYISFMFWNWILIPLIRRIADYYGTFVNPSPMLLAPYFVSMVSIITLVKFIPQSVRYNGASFAISFIGIIYGILIGFVNRAPYVVLKESMDWIMPISLGYYFVINWRQYPYYRQSIQKTFTWSVLFMGIYGIIQFLALPDWDRLWLMETGMFGATGTPDESGGMRVWSSMQSGEPFAAFMAAALLVMMTSQSYIALPMSIPGYISFLLSLVRSGWLGWLGGFLLLAGSLKIKFQIRLILLFAVIVLCIFPLSTSDLFGDKISARLETLSNVQEDSSATGRQEAFRDTINDALLNVAGDGIGGGTRDNIILATLFDLGWIGSIPYISGLCLLVRQVFTQKTTSDDLFIPTCKAVVLTALIRLPVNGSLLGLSGVLLWGFLGIAIAGENYYKKLDEQALRYETYQLDFEQ